MYFPSEQEGFKIFFIMLLFLITPLWAETVESGVKINSRKSKTLDNGDNHSKGLGDTNAVLDEFQCEITSVEDLKENLRMILEDSEKIVSGKEYACTILTLLKQSQVNSESVSTLESTINSTKAELTNLNQNITLETNKLKAYEKAFDDRVKATAAEVLVYESKLRDFISEKNKQFELRSHEGETLAQKNQKDIEAMKEAFNMTYHTAEEQANALESVLSDMNEKLKSWESACTELRHTVEDLASRSSKTELEIIEKISKISSEIQEIEDRLEAEIRNETERAIREEKGLSTFISDESLEIRNSFTKLETQLTEANTESDLLKKQAVENLRKQLSDLRTEFNQKLVEEFENANKSQTDLQNVVEAQFKLLESLESELRSKLEEEATRATLVEKELNEKLLNKTQDLSLNLETEVNRATFAENNLHKFVQEHDNKLKEIGEDLENRINQETLRAKGTEGQLSLSINSESERAQQTEKEIAKVLHANISRLVSEMNNEFTRAKNAEEKLEVKINEEITRSSNAESTLLANINNEIKRATEREIELEGNVKNEIEIFSKIEDQIRSEVNELVSKLKLTDEELNSKVRSSDEKIQEVRSEWEVSLEAVVKRVLESEVEIKEALEEEIRRAKASELGVLSSVMSEVVRAGDFEKSLRTNLTIEIERAQLVERSLKNDIDVKVADSGRKLEGLLTAVKFEVDKFQGLTSELSHNTTRHVLLLADELDKKFEIFNQIGETRITKLEDELNKCCNSGWFSRNPSSSNSSSTGGSGGGVLNRVFGIFGKRGTGSKKSTKKADSDSQSKKGVDVKETAEKADTKNSNKTDEELLSSAVSELDEDLLSELAQVEKARSFPHYRRSNSKVRNIYG